MRWNVLRAATAQSAPCLVWIADAPLDKLALAPQARHVLDVINPKLGRGEAYRELLERFAQLIVNSDETLAFLPERQDGRPWNAVAIPHHHCNRVGYRLPASRLTQPKTVGYVGEPEHLHDREAIEAAVRKLGLKFVEFPSRDLTGYTKIDIGVAWTRPDPVRDACRSNIKLANFAAHGIPCVVPDYAAYRTMEANVGLKIARFASSLEGVLEALAELAGSDDARQGVTGGAERVRQLYDLPSVARQYAEVLNPQG